MSWIKTIPFQEATGKLKRIYDRITGPDGNVDNVLTIHSLRPHTLEGHMKLYKSVLHNTNNTLPKWYLECLGIYVSHLNKCDYCVEHHYTGLKRLLNDPGKSKSFLNALKTDKLYFFFDNKERSGALYAKRLTLTPHDITEEDMNQLREEGFEDGEILEVNQVVSYFNYVNRTVVGLGVNTEGDVLGLSPGDSDDPDNWSHK